MIDGRMLLAWINLESTIERADDFGDLIDRGFVQVISDGESIIGLIPTGTAPVLPAMPAGTA